MKTIDKEPVTSSDFERKALWLLSVIVVRVLGVALFGTILVVLIVTGV